jgi:hypothetical protein
MARPAILLAISLFLMCRLEAAGDGCVASVALGTFQLLVEPPEGGDPRPLRDIHRLRAGQRLRYRPVRVPPDLRKDGRICLVLAPAGGAQKLHVFEPRLAAQENAWTAPFPVEVAGLVVGPQGLDRNKVVSLMEKDRELIAQLATYAEQTAQMETLVQALASAESDSSRNVEAVLSGFASRYGTSVPKLDRNAPTDQQAATLLHALMPTPHSGDLRSAGAGPAHANAAVGGTGGLGGGTVFRQQCRAGGRRRRDGAESAHAAVSRHRFPLGAGPARRRWRADANRARGWRIFGRGGSPTRGRPRWRSPRRSICRWARKRPCPSAAM